MAREEWPESKASFLNRTFFFYCWKLLLNGYKTIFTQDNLWNLDGPETSKNAYEEFMKEKERKNGSLASILFRTHWKTWLLSAIFKMISNLCTFVVPVIVSNLIQMADNRTEPYWHGYVYMAMFFVSQAVRCLTLNHQFHLMNKIGVRTKAALSACVYRKTLKLSPDSKRIFSSGEIQNFVSIDVCQFSEKCFFYNMIWSAPIELSLGVYFLYRATGVACLAGIAVIVLMVSINIWTSKGFHKFLELQMEHKDERMKILSEMIKNMKLIKFFAWEPAFQSLIERIRASEIKYLRGGAYFLGFSEICWSNMSNLACLAIFAAFVFINPVGAFTAEFVFLVVTVFYLIYVPLLFMPMAFTGVMSLAVSLKRLQHFLEAEEIVSYVSRSPALKDTAETSAVQIQDASFSWEKNGTPLVKNTNIQCDKGQLVAVIGPVGAGKSNLLSAILGEMYRLDGKVIVNGTIAYVPQHAWILNDTLRSNILFGKDHDLGEYAEVLEACALKPDLATLAVGDMTEIGERGINLSGGQKQRVSLARAVYQDRAIYLLDDPLSAVDVHVGKHLFDHVIGPKGMLKDKTRILVTHSLTYLNQCDRIAIMDQGRIVDFGSYADLNIKGKIHKYAQSDITQERQEETCVSDDDRMAIEAATDSLSAATAKAVQCAKDGKITGEESAELQKQWSGFKLYAKAAGLLLALYALVAASAYTFGMLSAIWLQVWTDHIAADGGNSSSNVSFAHIGGTKAYSKEEGIEIYGGIIGFQVLLSCCYVSIYVLFSIRASKVIHKSLLEKVIRAPMSFFDGTPSGRILNRFGKDISVIDNDIPFVMGQVMQCIAATILTYVPPIYANPIFAVIIIPNTVVFFLFQKLYVRSSRQFRRLEAVSRSPIYSRFQETLQGLDSVRAYEKGGEFSAIVSDMVDRNNRAHMSLATINVWRNVVIDFLCYIVITIAGFLAVWRFSMGQLSPGLMGVTLSVIIGLTDHMVWGSRESSTLETEVISLERVREYLKISGERQWCQGSAAKSPNWPSKGAIEFRNYSTRYRNDLPTVLKGLNFKIGAGKKVGIVGRTGSGKSTLASALFRLLEPTEGTILIDSVDITQIGLQDLRRNLTIIPQEPGLFIGTLRYNLDPFEEFTDEELWNALASSHMKNYAKGLPSGLESRVDEAGGNLSAGQRQLLCLARAILRRSRILILDEATASVDHSTDQLIQETIRSEFADCTVLTIAHRVGTILDYDRILVLENGAAVEYGAVKDVLMDKTSRFSQMATSDRLNQSDDRT